MRRTAATQRKRLCSRCGGEGELINEIYHWTDRTLGVRQDRSCPACGGTGYEANNAAVTVQSER